MPKIYRSMKMDQNGMPVVEASAKGLGVRPGTDVDVNVDGFVALNGQGMSVAPSWRCLPVHRIPKRLRPKFRDAIGNDELSCFSIGQGGFIEGPLATGLKLMPDSATHGNVVPVPLQLGAKVHIEEFQQNLALTQEEWAVDEG